MNGDNWLSSAQRMVDTVNKVSAFQAQNTDSFIAEYGRPFQPSSGSRRPERRRQGMRMRNNPNLLYSDEERKQMVAKQLENEKKRIELRVLELSARKKEQERYLTQRKEEAAKAEESAARELVRAKQVEREAEAIKKERLAEENRAKELFLEQERHNKEKRMAEEERRLVEAKNRSVELDLQMQSVSDWSLECAVCLSAQSRYSTVPCGHYALCAECAWDFVVTDEKSSSSVEHLLTETYYRRCKNSCPLCRTKIEGLLRIFITTASKMSSEQ